MSITPRQETLYQALNGIDDSFLDEVISANPHRTHRLLKRICAVAATVAIVFACFAFWPASNSGPIFTTTVSANDMDTTITVSADRVPDYTPDSGHIKDTLDPAWMNFDLFCVTVRMDGAEPEYLADSYVTVEYDGDLYTSDAQADQICVIFSQDQSPGVLCRIYGWAEDIRVSQLHFSIQIYHTENDLDSLIYTMPINIYYDRNKLSINGNFSQTSSKVSMSTNLLSTDELVDTILNADSSELPLYALSSADPYDSYKLATNYCDHILAVLDTRDDVANIMLQKLIELSELPKSEIQSDYMDYYIRYNTVYLILRYRYSNMLTEEEQAFLAPEIFYQIFGD